MYYIPILSKQALMKLSSTAAHDRSRRSPDRWPTATDSTPSRQSRLEQEAVEVFVLEKAGGGVDAAGVVAEVDAGEAVGCACVTAYVLAVWVFVGQDQDVCLVDCVLDRPMFSRRRGESHLNIVRVVELYVWSGQRRCMEYQTYR